MSFELAVRRSSVWLQRGGAHRVRVFGSVARGDSTSTSDVDFLVQLDDQRGLFDLGGLLMDLIADPDEAINRVTDPSAAGEAGRLRALAPE